VDHPVPVLMYHSISDRAAPSFRRWTVTPGRFAEHMAYLAAEGYTSLTASEYATCLAGDAALPSKPVLITFDDGYADFSSDALPVMRSHGLSSTLFVTSGYIGGSSEWLIREAETDRPMLTWDQLAGISGDDVEYGGHGYSHRQLDTLPLAEALDDVAAGKAMLENRTGRPVRAFAYPHGYSTVGIRRGLASLGFESAHAVVHAMSSLDDRPYAVSRLIVDADTDVAKLQSLLDPAAVPAHPARDSWRQTAWRWWRRGRLAVGIDSHHVPA
jgi:peptidoglycan/xylan/chitin deacetylase (PgdA/CDA1 family)